MNFVLKIQSFLDNFGKMISSLIRIIIFSKLKSEIRKVAQEKDIVILGNGPSLKKMIEEHESFLTNKELLCVNHFPNSDLYEKFRPKYYMTSAPDLWLDTIDAHFVQASKKLFSTMAEKTTWELLFFIPYESKKHKRWQNQLKQNSNIKIHYYNNTAVEGWQWFKFFFFKTNIGMPRPHNIMIPSIFNSINLGYKNIYLWGTDHSWLKEISVNEKNEALINQKHFYDETVSTPKTLDKRGVGARRLHEILHKLMLAFGGYFILKDYAENRNVKIINNTPNSYIDAFERQTLNFIK
jgi:hypothetical protein